MKYFLFIFFFLLNQLFFQLYCQENLKKVIDTNSSPLIKRIYLLNKSNKTHGEYNYYYKNKLLISGHFDDGNKTGRWIFMPTSDFKIIGEFENDLKNNRWIYIEKSDTIAILNFKLGIFCGEQQTFYSNGVIAEKRNFNELGEMHGKREIYYPQGNIKESFFYSKDKLHGDYHYYSEKGELIAKLIYYKNTPIHLETYSNDTSLFLYKGNLKHGNGYISTMIIDNETQKKQLFLTRNFKDSLLNGEIIGYKNGIVKFKGYFYNGFANENWLLFNSNGKVILKKKYSYASSLTWDSIKENFNNQDEPDIRIETKAKFGINKNDDLINFISKTLKYPEESAKKKKQGKVYIQFQVNDYGLIEKSKIIRGVDPFLDAESLRVINLLPNWIPAFRNRFPVESNYTIPINFIL